jgi:hypothetical protein
MNDVTIRRVRANIVAELGNCYFSLLLKSIIFMCAGNSSYSLRRNLHPSSDRNIQATRI